MVNMFKRWRYKKARKKRIEELRQRVDRVLDWDSITEETEITDEYMEDETRKEALIRLDHNEMVHLQQEDLKQKLFRSPIEVPNEHWSPSGRDEHRTLTFKGEAWARSELKKMWRQDVEFWFKLVVPILALILSIIALVHKSR
jgi:hypothetical protein